MRPTVRDGQIAVTWAFAEATLFFVIPDVWLTWVAVQPKATLSRLTAIALVAVLAAVFGGCLLFGIARHSPQLAASIVTAVPSVSANDFEKVQYQFRAGGVSSIATAWVRGEPYKLYSVAAGEVRAGLGSFVMASVIGRGVRFLLTAFVALGLAKLVGRPRIARGVWAVLWICVYVVYWRQHPLW